MRCCLSCLGENALSTSIVYALWTTMNSDLVYEQRQTFFTVLFCRQIVWAVLAESRVFFSRRLSVDDFTGVHPDDVEYPRSQLLSIIANVRDGTPIVRGSFPSAWYPPGHVQGLITGSTAGNSARVTSAPVPSIATTQGGTTPTVVSGLTTGSTRTPRPPIEIRGANIHPKIKQAMEGVATLSVPLVVETGTGKHWGEAH